MKYLKLTIILGFIAIQIHAQSNNTTTYSGVDGKTKVLMADGTEKEIHKIRKGDKIKTVYIDSIEIIFGTSTVKKLVEFTGSDISNIVLLNDAHLSFTNNQPLLTKYEVPGYKEQGENGYIEFSTRYNRWAAGIVNQSSKTPIKKISMTKLNKSTLMCFIGKDSELEDIDPEDLEPVLEIVHIKKINLDTTINSNRMYTLKLKKGNTFIANGFIVKTK